MGQIACYTGKPITWEEAVKSEPAVRPGAGRGRTSTRRRPTKPDETGNYPLPMPGVTKLV